MKKVLLFLAMALVFAPVFPCTTFIISGKHTRDGRPVLYKHRDTGTLNNALVYFNDGKYDYIGLVDSNQDWKTMVFGGYNSAGFAIMNSVAYNMNIGDTTRFGDQEGIIMKLALQQCATLSDFEKLLDELPKPLGVDTNFGVIDASGGAAYYETGNYGYKKIDANDPAVAPFGYLIRTNHAFTGPIDKGAGYIRYETANETLYRAVAMNSLDPQYLLNNISRNLYHSLMKENLAEKMPRDGKNPVFRYFEDYIPRNSSASAIMVIGAKKGEDPSSVMMWSVVGWPLSAVAVPVWLSAGKPLPAVVSMKENLHSPLCDASLALKMRCFPVRRESGPRYINLAALINEEKTGIRQLLDPVEDEIFRKTADIAVPLSGSSKTEKIRELYKWLDEYIPASYFRLFRIEMK